MYRFHQSEQIAERISSEAARKVTASVVGEVGENEVRVGVFNPLAGGAGRGGGPGPGIAAGLAEFQ